jgi:hypothetical protein
MRISIQLGGDDLIGDTCGEDPDGQCISNGVKLDPAAELHTILCLNLLHVRDFAVQERDLQILIYVDLLFAKHCASGLLVVQIAKTYHRGPNPFAPVARIIHSCPPATSRVPISSSRR